MNFDSIELIDIFWISDWPYGTYSMITPRSGCPSGWKWGWRYQDNEDTGNLNRMTSGHHFNGEDILIT